MDEYISRETAIKSTWMILEGMGYPRSGNRSLERTVESVFKSAPAADVVEVRHGRWERIYDKSAGGPRLMCSLCRSRSLYAFYYCSDCGAIMDRGQDNG